MNLAVRFLHALAQALSTIGLYTEVHPARVGALEKLHEMLEEIQAENEKLSFTFLGDEVVYLGTPLRELKGWALSTRLSKSGIERIEFTPGVSLEELGAFVVGRQGLRHTTSLRNDNSLPESRGQGWTSQTCTPSRYSFPIEGRWGRS